MKARIPQNSILMFDKLSLQHSEKTMTKTWENFREAICTNTFEFDDTTTALSTTFLKQFDRWFEEIGKSILPITIHDALSEKFAGRGTIIKPEEDPSKPNFDRFLPKSEYIKEDNRFSPPGVEWLYLAVGEELETIQKCAENECRANTSNRFGFCTFMTNPKYENLYVIDLTIADEMTYDEINEKLKILEEKTLKEAKRYAKKYGFAAYKYRYDDKEFDFELKQWCLYTYAKMMSKNIFVPLNTPDKKREYAPFQTLAMYFISKGYSGIIYSSTVYPKAKNLVLFDKNYAIPYGMVYDYTIR